MPQGSHTDITTGQKSVVVTRRALVTLAMPAVSMLTRDDQFITVTLDAAGVFDA